MAVLLLLWLTRIVLTDSWNGLFEVDVDSDWFNIIERILLVEG